MLKQNFALNYLKEFLSDHNVSLKKGTESAPPFPSNVSPASRPPGVTIYILIIYWRKVLTFL